MSSNIHSSAHVILRDMTFEFPAVVESENKSLLPKFHVKMVTGVYFPDEKSKMLTNRFSVQIFTLFGSILGHLDQKN